MGKLLAFLLLLVPLGLTAQAPRPEPIWQPLIGWHHDKFKAYVDVTSLEIRTVQGKNKLSSGGFLLVANEPVELTTEDGEKITVTAIARYLIADCKKNLTAPIIDFYFDNKDVATNPKILPIGGLDYTDVPLFITHMAPGTAIMRTLCTEYI